MFKDIDLCDAQEILLNQVSLLSEEIIPVSESFGRVAAQELTVLNDFPPVAQAAVDGFAIHGDDLHGAFPLLIKKYLRFGDVPPSPLAPGEVVGVLTGVPVPEGTAAVVPFELVKVQDETVSLPYPVKPNLNIKQPGEDFKQGEVLAAPGKVITAGLISALLANGISRAKVYRRTKVAILGLTSNVVDSLNHLHTGQIFDSNGPLLKALITRDGGEVIVSSFPFNEEVINEEILKEADLIITVGGTFSQSDSEAVNLLRRWKAEILFWGIKMKPGSHMGAGLWNNKPVLCLSGNPMACAVGYELLAGPLILKMQGLPYMHTQVLAKCTNSISLSRQNVTRFIYGKAECSADGWKVEVLSMQKSSMIRPLIDGNVLIELPAGQTGITAGSDVTIRLLEK